jgi:hypothetical protein
MFRNANVLILPGNTFAQPMEISAKHIGIEEKVGPG